MADMMGEALKRKRKASQDITLKIVLGDGSDGMPIEHNEEESHERDMVAGQEPDDMNEPMQKIDLDLAPDVDDAAAPKMLGAEDDDGADQDGELINMTRGMEAVKNPRSIREKAQAAMVGDAKKAALRMKSKK